MKKILLVFGHADKRPSARALADEYNSGATAAGHEVRRLDLGRFGFDPILKQGYKVIQELEPDLVKAQESILWADHLGLCLSDLVGDVSGTAEGFYRSCFFAGFCV